MQNSILADLQFFAAAELTPAGGGETAPGVSAADAGQSAAESAAQQSTPPRRSWAEVKADYRADFDAEVQGIVQKRLRGAQEKLRQYEAQEAERQTRGEESRRAAETEARRRTLAAALRRGEAARHFSALCAQAEALRERVPDFDLMRELENDAFAEITRPGSAVGLEQAYYALHPELRSRETQEAAQRAAEAVSAAVRSGAARPRENGAQSASLGALNYKSMSRGQREELKRRIYAAGAMGGHLPAGG